MDAFIFAISTTGLLIEGYHSLLMSAKNPSGLRDLSSYQIFRRVFYFINVSSCVRISLLLSVERLWEKGH